MPYDFANMSLPVEPVTLKGPAVEAWDARKEENDNPKVSTADFLANYERMKPALIRNIRRLADGQL